MSRSSIRAPRYKVTISGGQQIARAQMGECIIATVAQLRIGRSVFIRDPAVPAQVLEVKPDGSAIFTDHGFIPNALGAPPWTGTFLVNLKANMPTLTTPEGTTSTP